LIHFYNSFLVVNPERVALGLVGQICRISLVPLAEGNSTVWDVATGSLDRYRKRGRNPDPNSNEQVGYGD
jgi:hypothetical protein